MIDFHIPQVSDAELDFDLGDSAPDPITGERGRSSAPDVFDNIERAGATARSFFDDLQAVFAGFRNGGARSSGGTAPAPAPAMVPNNSQLIVGVGLAVAAGIIIARKM